MSVSFSIEEAMITYMNVGLPEKKCYARSYFENDWYNLAKLYSTFDMVILSNTNKTTVDYSFLTLQ